MDFDYIASTLRLLISYAGTANCTTACILTDKRKDTEEFILIYETQEHRLLTLVKVMHVVTACTEH